MISTRHSNSPLPLPGVSSFVRNSRRSVVLPEYLEGPKPPPILQPGPAAVTSYEAERVGVRPRIKWKLRIVIKLVSPLALFLSPVSLNACVDLAARSERYLVSRGVTSIPVVRLRRKRTGRDETPPGFDDSASARYQRGV